MDSTEPERETGNMEENHADAGDLDDDGDMVEGQNAEFTLEEVLRLGGTKKDYMMLACLEEVEVLVDGGKKAGVIDDLEDGELQAFIDKLGLGKLSKTIALEEEPARQEKGKNAEPGKEKVKEKKSKKKEARAESKKDAEKKDGAKVQRKETSASTAPKNKGRPKFEFFERPNLLIKPGGKWYDHEYTNERCSQPQSGANVKNYKSLAEKLYEHEVSLYKNKKKLQKGANSAWMNTVVSTGTLADRMAAMTVLIQDAPVHTVRFLENLLNLLRKQGSRRQNIMSVDTFKDLLLSDLLPDNRKLLVFENHPFDKLEEMSSGNRDARDRRLILWFFEEQLKGQVAEFVKVLDILSHDNLLSTKAKALNVTHELLCNKPEEEKALLTLLVNKLGDPQYRIATKASYLMEVLLSKHPNMKVVVCLEIERLLYRPNVSEKAQYYGICFLNQIMFSHEETDLANQLITVYFSFFKACIKKKDIDCKILRGLLTGVNRAYPYANIASEKVKEQLETLFKIVHVVSFNTSVQVLMLLFQVMDSQQTVSNRFYAVLYKKLLDPGLSQGSKQAMFLNLLYKSMKADVVLRRVKAFVKRLLQVTCCQKPPFICGALYLLSEVLKLKPGLKVLIQENGEEDDEEHFHDIPDDDENDVQEQEKSLASAENANAGSWIHQKTLQGLNNSNTYDPLNRNPLFCGADSTSLWELKLLSHHFHPSVALFAKTILEGNAVQYTGDPLQDFTLMRFLDRFVYRNPKPQKAVENRGYLMHQRKKLYMNNQRQLVNSDQFLAKEESEVPVDEVFFHRFFKRASKEKQKFKRDEDEDSIEDVDDDEFEEVIDAFEGDSLYSAADLDFAGNVNPINKDTKKTKEEDDSSSDWEMDAEDEEVSLGSMCEEDFEEESGGVFMDPSDNDKRPEKKAKKRPLKDNDDDMFATAEEFGDLLDENSGSKFDNIGLNAMANKDNASVKQLKWEADRDIWVHDRISKSKKANKKFSKKVHKVGKK
uniref:CCAAT/enhancer-binding protein zeta n=1 Tax=Leptobrachium leishanense TaxID=445787 RepID=A0A8C5QQE6_9ANUR